MNSFAFGFSTSLLVWTTSSICNVIAKWIGSSTFRVPGILLSVIMSLFLVFLYARWWTKKTSLLFYAAFFPNLVLVSYDFLSFVDLWMNPSKGFISEYFDMDEPLIHNSWMIGIIIFDAFILGAANYLVLYLIHSGLVLLVFIH
ncbi:unnamed protein product [Allacma fusca]|uniref:Uncharacterized protein n=2 Tax=Allacma fusca TaxID=39272 RepID=A0A8J2KQZ0_9HEXA|nr:unnamed protein product [Allacma fusca]